MKQARRTLRWIGLIAVVVVGCSEDANNPVGPASGRMTVTLSGTIEDFYLRGLLHVPFSVEKGEPVEVILSYLPESDWETCSEASCSFAGFRDSWLTLRTRRQSWTVPIDRISLNEDPQGDDASVSGIALSPLGLLGHLGLTQVSADFSDSELPYDMLTGTELQHMNLTGTIEGRLSIRSLSSDGESWQINCSLSTDPGSSP